MNNKEFIAALSRKTGATKENTQRMVNAVIAAMSDTFDNGENVMISNFGTFEPKKRMERIFINPTSGQRMLVPPKVVLNFKPAQQVKEDIRKGGAE